MKKLLLTLGLAALTVAGARADGTISFLPGTAGRVTMPGDDGGSQPVNFPFYVAVYWSADGNNWNPPVEPFGIGSATTGLFSVAGNGSFYVIPGTEEFQTVSMLIYAWQASYGDDPYAAWQAGSWTTSTGVREIRLGAEAGPGTVIWQGATGTDPDRFRPLVFSPARPEPPPVVPEPSTLALGALGGLMLFFRVRSSKK